MAQALTVRTLATELAVYDSPGLGIAWPELSAQILAIYQDRVAKFTWVPGDWLARVRSYMADTGAVLRMLPPRLVGGAVRDDLPAWLTADERRLDAWSEVSEIIRNAVVDYAAMRAAEGKAELDRLYRNAAFWDRLYTATKFVADLPSNAVKAVGTGVGRVFAANWLVLLVVGAAALLWFNKGSIARAAGKRLAKG